MGIRVTNCGDIISSHCADTTHKMILFFVIFIVGIMISPGQLKTVDQLEKELEFLEERVVGMESKIKLLENNENLEEKLTTKMLDMVAGFVEKMERRLDSSESNEIIAGSPKEQTITFVNEKSKNTTDDRLDYLEEVSKMNVKRSCEEMRQYGITTSGAYFVDPDGPLLGSNPFRVWCNFTEGGLAITEVLHDSEDLIEVGHCKEAGCYVHNVIYTAPQDQIQSLILLSQDCEQTIRYDCYLAPLMTSDVNLGYWLDKEGQEQIYWHGAHSGEHVCSCFYEDGCLDGQSKHTKCNCDAQVPDMQSDIGSITNVTALPIQQLAFGGLEYEAQQAFHALGRLRCWGSKEVVEGTSCAAIKRSGQFHSGFYNVRKDEAGNSQLVYCNMTVTPGYQDGDGNQEFVESSEDHFNRVEEAMENIKDDISANDGKITTNVAKISALEDDVNILQMKSAFCGFIHTWTNPNTVINYEKLLVEDNNVAGASFNKANGRFLSGANGIYKVDFSIGFAEKDGGAFSEIYLYINGAKLTESRIVSDPARYDTSGRSMMISLNEGDYIDVHIETAKTMHDITFCVFLLN